MFPRLALVLGLAQQGKTTLALDVLRKRAPRLLVLDPVASKPMTALLRDGGAKLCRRADALDAWFRGQTASGEWRVVLRCEDDADYAAVLVQVRYLRHVTVLVDEALYFCGSSELAPLLIRASRANAHYGGGIGVPLWITAQRPHDVPPDIRSQADAWVSFRQEEPRDLRLIEERCNPGYAAAVATLGDHQWLAWPESLTPIIGHRRASYGTRNRGRDHRGGDSDGRDPTGAAVERVQSPPRSDGVSDHGTQNAMVATGDDFGP